MSEPRHGTHSLLSLLFDSPLAAFVLCIPVFMATSLLLVGTDLQSFAFWSSREVRLWHMLMAIWPTLFAGTLVAALNDIRRKRFPWPGTRNERTAVVLCTVLASLMYLLPFASSYYLPGSVLPANAEVLTRLPDFRTKTIILNILGVVVLTLHTAGMFSVHAQLLTRPRESSAGREKPEAASLREEVLRYQYFRSRLERYLGFSATLTGISLLNVGALRDLLNEASPGPAELLPAGIVMAYGIYFTGMLAIIYLPAHRTLKELGQGLAERLVRQSLDVDADWKQSFEEQRTASTYLGLQGSALQELQQGLTVLAPLLASISALVLGSGG
jgi:hypothetical protein